MNQRMRRSISMLCLVTSVMAQTTTTTTTTIPTTSAATTTRSGTNPEEDDTFYFAGSDDCPCIETRITKLVECRNVVEKEEVEDEIPTNTNVTTTKNEDGNIRCYPEEFGSSYCQPHDLQVDPACTNPTNRSLVPQHCYDTWCYVDYEKCQLSEHPVYKSLIGLDYYWSYSTCQNDTSYVRNKWETREIMLSNLHSSGTVTVAIPEIWYPRHYKWKRGILKDDDDDGNTIDLNDIADYDGEEYYDDSIPWQGWMIDYFHDLEQRIIENEPNVDTTATYDIAIQPFEGFEFTYRSKGADALVNHSSSWSAALEDIAAGVHTIAGSTYWITADRMQIASFSTPVAVDKFYLWVPPPTLDTTIYGNFAKILQPFTPSLWYCLLGCIGFTSLLAVLFSNDTGTQRRWYQQFHNDTWYDSSIVEKVLITIKILCDAILAHAAFLAGHMVDYDIYANYSKKILYFGYAFLVIIVVASYTANLTAFLTRTQVGDYLRDMEQAIDKEIPICAPWSLQHDLIDVWPTAKFIFPNDATAGGYQSMLELYGNGQCTALVAGAIDDILDMWCTYDLFNTGSIVLEKPLGFPTNSLIVGGISHYILEAQKDGIELADYYELTDTTDPALCSSVVENSPPPTDTEDELGRLTPEHFILPFTVLVGSAVLAVLVHWTTLYLQWKEWKMVEDEIEEEIEKDLQKAIAEDTKQQHSTNKNIETVDGLEVLGNNHHDSEDEHAATRRKSSHLATSTKSLPTATTVPSPSPITKKSSSMIHAPSALHTTGSPRNRTPRPGHISSRSRSGTTSSTRPHHPDIISIEELTTILQDGESTRDIHARMEAMKFLSQYQQQICTSLEEDQKKNKDD